LTGAVLDASAVLAVLYEEPGAKIVSAVMDDAMVGAVNHAEIVGKLIDDGFSADQASIAVAGTNYNIVSLDDELAFLTGVLRRETRSFGLSLGDRACLALAKQQGLPCYTADKRWADLEAGIDVRIIR